MEQHTYIPSFECLHNNRVDLQIKIRKDGSEFLADIMDNLKAFDPIPIPIKEEDLRQINEDIREEISSMIDHRGKFVKSYNEALFDLAKVGHGAFIAAFGNSQTLDIMQDLLLKRIDITHIQITSKDFHLPWELLYPASLSLPISPNRFLGMRFVLARSFPVPYSKERSNATKIETVRPKVGLLCDDSLPTVKTEIDYFDDLHNRNIIELTPLSKLDSKAVQKQHEFEKFKLFFRQDFDIAHFACHVNHVLNRPNASYLVLSDNFRISIKDMNEYDMSIVGSPIVVFNACKTGIITPLSTSNMASIFYRFGASAVLATEADIPDEFASEFAIHLYSRLLQGETIGNSLFLTRREYALGDEQQLWGLLYSLYGPHSVCFVITEQSSSLE